MKLRYQLIGALLSGALVCLSFPTVIFGWRVPEMGWLAWFALVPLVVAVREASPRRAFALTFVMGLVAYSGSLYWIFRAMNTYGKLPAATSALVMALMIVILAAYIALAPMLARLIKERWHGELIALLPACWVAVELARNYGPVGGFPWADVSMSQWRAIYVIQIVDVVGIYGLIFLIVWVNVCLAEVAARLMGARVAQLPLKVGITAVLILSTLAYGYYRIHAVGRDLAQAGDVKIGMVQANIPQEDKWKDSKAMDNLDAYRGPTSSLSDAGVELVVWPEASFPWPIDTRAIKTDPVALGLGRGESGEMPYVLMGAISERPDGTYHNSVVLFDAQGEIKGRYHKAHLVPFGEYVPYKKLLFFASKLTEPVGNFEPGASFAPLDVGGWLAGPLVCY
jgi:apolipoprotein N-acyltransferase